MTDGDMSTERCCDDTDSFATIRAFADVISKEELLIVSNYHPSFRTVLNKTFHHVSSSCSLNEIASQSVSYLGNNGQSTKAQEVHDQFIADVVLTKVDESGKQKVDKEAKNKFFACEVLKSCNCIID